MTILCAFSLQKCCKVVEHTAGYVARVSVCAHIHTYVPAMYIDVDETEADRGLIFNTTETKHVEYCRRYRPAVLLYPDSTPRRIRMYIPVYYG